MPTRRKGRKKDEVRLRSSYRCCDSQVFFGLHKKLTAVKEGVNKKLIFLLYRFLLL